MEWAPLSTPIVVGDTPVQLLAAIVESSDDAIVATTLDGTVLSWNRGAEELYGYSAGEMLGQKIAAVVPPDRGDELAEILARVGALYHDIGKVAAPEHFVENQMGSNPHEIARRYALASTRIAGS